MLLGTLHAQPHCATWTLRYGCLGRQHHDTIFTTHMPPLYAGQRARYMNNRALTVPQEKGWEAWLLK